MLTRREKALNELGLLYTTTQKSKSYTRQNTPGSQFDLNQFLRGKPFWRKIKIKEQPKLKKIIINYWQVLTDNTALDSLWHTLNSEKFEIYIYNKSNQLVKINYHSKMNHALNEIQLLPTDILQEKLTAQGINTNEYCLLDHIQIKKLLLKYNELQKLSDNTEKKIINNLFDEDTISTSPQYPTLFQLLRTTTLIKQFQKLHLKFKANESTYEFIWRNNFTKSELDKFLTELNKRNTKIISEAFSLNNLFLAHIEINNPDHKNAINFPLLPESEINHVSKGGIFTPAFDLLKEVEELEINFSDPAFDELKKLRRLKLETIFLSKDTGLENCQNLDEVILTGRVDSDNLKYLTKEIIKSTKKISDSFYIKLSILNSLYYSYKILSRIESMVISESEDDEKYDFSLHTKLKSLEFHRIKIKEITGLDKCIDLEEITLSGRHTSENLKIIMQSIKNLPRLKKLTIRYTDTVEVINLQGLTKLEEINIEDCNLKNITGLNHCSNLRGISLNRCSINNLNLSGLSTLTSLTLHNCTHLKEIVGIEECTSLFFRSIDDNNQLSNDALKTINSHVPFQIIDEDIYDGYSYWNDKTLDNPPLFNIRPYLGPIPANVNRVNLVGDLKQPQTVKLVPSDISNSANKKSDNRSNPDNKLGKNSPTNSNNKSQDSTLDTKKTEDKTLQDKKQNNDSTLTTTLPPKAEKFSDKKLEGANPTDIKLNTDTKTLPNETIEARELFIGSNNKSLTIPTNYYRLGIRDQITVDSKRNVTFTKKITTDFKTYQLPSNIDNTDHTYHAVLPSWTLFPGEKYILNGLSKEDILINISDVNKIDIQHSTETGEYQISLKKDEILPLTNLSYTIKKDPNNFIKDLNTENLVVDVPTPALPPILKIKIHDLFKKYQDNDMFASHFADFYRLAIKIQHSKNPTDKLKAIIKYCKAFKNESLSKTISDPLSNLITIIEEGKGSCTHRSEVFLTLCQFFQIPARIIDNDIHMYVEILISTNQGNKWKSIDLGGHESKIILKTNSALLSSSSYYEKLLPDSQWQLECKNINDVIDKLLIQKKSPLIRLKKPTQTKDWHAAINAYCSQKQIQTVYINSATDLFTLLELDKVENSTFKTINGPLRNLLNHGKGIIVINWSTFSANERAIFKSMLDTPPTLHGAAIPAQIRIIGLLEKSIKPNDIFLSRCQETHLLPHIALPEIAGPQELLKQSNALSLKDEKIPEINLYHRNDWENFLLDTVSIHSNELICKEGPLLQCMRLGQPLIIKNAPLDNQEFQLFLQKLSATVTFFFNGEQVKIMPGFKIILKESTSPTPMPSEVKFDVKPIVNERKKIYISPYNFDRLFNSKEITNDGKTSITSKGILSQYKQDQQIIFEKSLTQDEQDYLYDEITKLKQANPQLPEFHFHVLSTNAETNIQQIQEFTLPNINTKIETNDPLLLVHQLRETEYKKQDQKKIPDSCIFHTSIENNWSTLFEEINFIKKDNKLHAVRKESLLWEKLKSGKTVVLCGPLLPEEYEAIKSLFYPIPYLDINGQLDYNIPGKLIWISQPQPELTSHRINIQKFQATLDTYEKQLKMDLHLILPSLLNNTTKFFTILDKISNREANHPSKQHMTYDKYKAIYQYNLSKSKNDNPIKPIFQYFFHKKSAQYSYLNVIAKFLFIDSNKFFVRKEKLKKILSDNPINKANFWQIANCFSGAALKKIFNNIPLVDLDQNDIPAPTDQMVQALSNSIDQFPSKLPRQDRYQKQQKLLSAALKDPQKPLILLLGESGTGKTFSAKNLIKTRFFVGEEKILNWLQARDKKNPVVLLLDEANLEVSGKWEFLRGLTESPPTITYAGKTYPLTSQHKVVFTGNPLNYPGRNWQPIFWDKSHIIWFGPLQKSFIRERAHAFLRSNESSILSRHLNDYTGYFSNLTNIIAESYQYLIDNANYLYEITLRDIHNICARFKLTGKNITKAIYEEISGILPNDENRNKFKEFLSSLDNNAAKEELKKLPKDIVITSNYYPAWSTLVDDMLLCQQRIKLGTNFYGKLGLLLEGPSGVGKSTMLIKLAEMFGYSADTKDTQKKIYQITTGSLNVKEILLKAFHEGSIVILDELNLDQEIETLLNQLMSGVDLNDKPAKKTGFMVLATQNPSHSDGVIVNSKALTNRFHKVSLPEFDDNDITYIAKQLKHPEPEIFKRIYREVQNKFPHVNARNMFEALKPDINPTELLTSHYNSHGLFKNDEKMILQNESSNNRIGIHVY